MVKSIAVIGSGPAGLSAALKLSENNFKVSLIDKDSQVGGLCKTVCYKGYRFDVGGHRFFSKSKEVNKLWEDSLGKEFLLRPRLSRIYYRNKFFDYPIKPLNALSNLGLVESINILLSYTQSKFFPFKEEKTFEQWVSNRFGKRLFNHFFKSYTEKLWGIPCREIQSEWAAQRIKGLSLSSAVKNAVFPDKKGKIKTLISEFRYPKYGPGMMYESIASNFVKNKGNLLLNQEVISLNHKNNRIVSLVLENNKKRKMIKSDHFISSMPITDLIQRLSPKPPEKILQASRDLHYRSFVTVSLILKSLEPFPDTWIYVHSPEVKLGRVQNFKRWSPFMVPQPGKVAIGAEYFCTEGDEIWSMKDEDLVNLALKELEKIKLVKKSDYIEGFVIRAGKSYPVYDSSYPKNIKLVKGYLARFKNLISIGRPGMFKYNNMDHSILSGLYAAENLLGANHNLEEINADQDYQEEEVRHVVK